MSLASIFKANANEMLNQVYTMSIGEIIELDMQLMRASKVRLIDEAETGPYEDHGELYIYNIPLNGITNDSLIIVPPYKVGDKVTVLFSHRDITNILENDGSDPMPTNFDKSDAVILGHVNLFTNPINVTDWEEGEMVIKAPNDNLTIKIDNDLNIEVKTIGNVYLGDKEETEPMPLGRQLKEWLDNHTHTNQGAGKPVNNSPNLSERVHNA